MKSSIELKTFIVPVCEDHYYGDQADCRYKFLCFVSDGFCSVAMMLAMLTIGGNIWAGHPVDQWALLTIMVFVVFMTLTLYAFRANAFQTAVRIVGFDPSLENVIFEFKNPGYRDAFLKENPMSSELVNWVVRG